MGMQANQICQALGTGQATSVACNGRTWVVGSCGSGIELGTSQLCFCSTPGYTIRPCIGVNNPNWGGVNSNTCSGPSQTIEVICG